MSNDFLPFSKPVFDQATIDEVVDCLKTGWITTGPKTKRFEEDLKTYLGAKHALALSSGTAGLHLCLLSMNLQPGDEIITTPMTFVATTNTIILAGGKPVFVDVDPHNYNIDANLIEAAITNKTRAIMPVHFAGLPVDLDPIYDLAKKYNLRVIEDAAHAIGTEYKSKRIGSFGDTQVFSFHPIKNITTGEGGCVTTTDDKLAEEVVLQRFHGMDREAWNRYQKKGSPHYEIIRPGLKYNMMDMQAAIGIHQLQKLDSFIDQRQAIVDRYYELFNSWDSLALPGRPNYSYRHAWHLFTPLINAENAGINRDDFMQQMKDKGVGTGLHYRAVHLYPYYRETFGYKEGDFPHAEHIGNHIVSLPLFPGMTEQQQDQVVETMKDIFK